jgi:hypothetical protein
VQDVAGPASAQSGQQVTVTWRSTNTSTAPATGTWTEKLYLSSDDAIGGDVLIATFIRIGPLDPGQATVRTESVTLPSTGSASAGSLRFVVVVDADNELAEDREANNAAIAVAPIDVAPVLTLTLPSTNLPENQPGGTLTATLTRSGNLLQPLTVTLASSDPQQATVPATVTIPAGQSSVTFPVAVVQDGLVDGDHSITVTATSAGFTGDAASLTIVDVDVPTLTLTFVATVAEGDTVFGTVRRNNNLDQPLVVSLDSSKTDQLQVPATVTIPAGQAQVQFALVSPDDTIVEKPDTVAVTALASGYPQAQRAVTVADNDVPTLSLVVNPGAVSEGGGASAAVGTVTRSIVSDRPFHVKLFSSDATAATVPATVTIPANAASVTFMIAAVDDATFDGTQHVVITAYGAYDTCGCTITAGAGVAPLDVLDDEAPALRVVLAKGRTPEGTTVAATVTRYGDPSQALVVQLASSDTTELAVPPSVTIPAGQASASFTVTAVDDGVTDGAQTAIISASAPGLVTGTTSIEVTDIQLPDLVISRLIVPATANTGGYFDVTYRVTNQGRTPAAGTWQQRIFLSRDDQIGGNDLLVGTFSLTATLDPGLYFERTVPVLAPDIAGTYWVVATDDFADQVAESDEANNSTLSAPLDVLAEYQATVSTPVTTQLASLAVPLTGHASLRDGGAPAQFKLVNIHLQVRGTTRVISAVTDAGGNFSTTFIPLPGEAGHYTVFASHPGVSSGSAQDDFTLIGVGADRAPQAYALVEGATPLSSSITVRNLSEVPLTNLRVQVVSKPSNVNVVASILGGNLPNQLPGDAGTALAFSLSATDASTASGTVLLRITSDEGASVDVPLNVTVQALRPSLSVDPSSLVSAMRRGGQTIVGFTVRNDGGLASGPLQLLLPNVPWMHALQGTSLPSLAPGESATIGLLLTPAADLALAEYSGTLAVVGTAVSVSVPFNFRAVSDATGSLDVEVTDEYTYFASGAPRVAGALVKIIDPISGNVLAQQVTDATGHASFPNLTEDYYKVAVTAPLHFDQETVAYVQPGTSNTVSVFIPRETVRYNFQVNPVDIQDRTQITIETLFETNVPFPVLTIDPGVIDLRNLTQAYTQVDLTITNHGLIASQDAHLYYDKDNPLYEFKPLIDDIGTIPAKSSVTIPVLMRLKPPAANAPASLGGAAADACVGFSAGVYDRYFCGKLVERNVPIQFIYTNPFCGGPIDPTGGGGGGGGGGDLVEVRVNGGKGTSTIDLCDPCLLAKLQVVLECVVGFIAPEASCPFFAIRDCVNTLKSNPSPTPSAGEIFRCIAVDGLSCVGKYRLGTIISILTCFYDFQHACDGLPGGAASEPTLTSDSGSASTGLTGAAAAAADVLGHRAGWLQAYVDTVNYLYGNNPLLTSGDGDAASAILTAFGSYAGDASVESGYISADEQAALLSMPLPNDISSEDVEALITRWNRSADYWGRGILNSTDVPAGESTDFVALDVLDEKLQPIADAEREAADGGFTSIFDGYYRALLGLKGALVIPLSQSASSAEPGGLAAGDAGVCAQVRLKTDQEAVLTRDAFRATLELDNATPAALSAIGASLFVTDAAGNDVSGLFLIRPPTLTGLSGVDGSGTLATGVTGTAVWELVPATDAALAGPTAYFVSGTLSYVDNGIAVDIPISGVQITVFPQPELSLQYFHQRDVFSDDPHTTPVEPSQPFSLAVMVRNDGSGAARDLRITSAQPQIVENEKGLLIDFKIIATQVAGQNLEPTLSANFGTVQPGEVKIATWLMTSTLQGLFTDYKATFQNLSGLGDHRFSIIKSVEIHEMIHTLAAPGDAMPDFLVNDDPDAGDLPDHLYLSDGSVLPVALATGGTFDGASVPSTRTLRLTTDAASGWTYLNIADPGQGLWRVSRITRSDGTDVPTANFWQSDRTFIGLGKRPMYENMLHLADVDSTGSYTVYFEPIDQTPPTGQVDAPRPQVGGVPSVALHFSEAVKNFDLADLVLSRDGGPNLLTGAESLTSDDAITWTLSGLTTVTAAPGQYVLRLSDTADVTDLYANAVSGPVSGSFTILAHAQVADRHVFYNNSKFDGNDPLATASDDAAVATDKVALLPGGTATFANYTSYSRGINGVMVDVLGLPATTLTAADFTFMVGNSSDPSTWAAAPAPTSITVRQGAGPNGSDRVTLTWDDNAIQKQWLQVTLLADANTGLAAPDVFYFGNAIGDSGNSTTDARVNSTDEIAARNNPRGILNPAPVTFAYDYNRDGRVNSTDEILARSNSTGITTALRLITLQALLDAAEPASQPATTLATVAVTRPNEDERISSTVAAPTPVPDSSDAAASSTTPVIPIANVAATDAAAGETATANPPTRITTTTTFAPALAPGNDVVTARLTKFHGAFASVVNRKISDRRTATKAPDHRVFAPVPHASTAAASTSNTAAAGTMSNTRAGARLSLFSTSTVLGLRGEDNDVLAVARPSGHQSHGRRRSH